jgi:hypothetical protein
MLLQFADIIWSSPTDLHCPGPKSEILQLFTLSNRTTQVKALTASVGAKALLKASVTLLSDRSLPEFNTENSREASSWFSKGILCCATCCKPCHKAHHLAEAAVEAGADEAQSAQSAASSVMADLS